MKQQIVMPNLGAASDEATLVSWLVSAGTAVEPGQPIFEVETDKAVVTVEATDPGTVLELLVPEGTTVGIGTPIAVLDVPDATSGIVGTAPPQDIDAAAEARSDSPSGLQPPGGGRMTPRARRLAEELGVDAASVTGSGPDGRVLEADVRAAAPAADEGLHKRAEFGRGPTDKVEDDRDPLAGLSGHRAAVARLMAASSHDAAAVTITMEVRAGGLLDATKRMRAAYPALAESITVDLLMAALVARGLRRHPALNASLTPEGILLHPAVHVGIALDSSRGLLVPVLQNADTRTVDDLAAEWAALRRRTLAGNATLDDMSGGTFTVTNLGHLHVDAFTPIINRGECAILGIGAIRERAVATNGRLEATITMVLSLTFDHRIVDGAPAARYLDELAGLLEHPEVALENA